MSVPIWSLKELREKTADTLGECNRQGLSDFLDSFHWKSQAVHYHLLQADDCFKDYSDMDEIRATQMFLSGDQGMSLAAKIREISLVSSVMMVSTLPDTLAQVVNLLFLENRLHVNRLYLNDVIKELESGAIKERLESLSGSEGYAYVSAFANTIKHVNLVKSGYHISFENGLHGIRFKEFQHKNRSFLEMIDRDIIEVVRNMRAECLGLGVAINSEWR